MLLFVFLPRFFRIPASISGNVSWIVRNSSNLVRHCETKLTLSTRISVFTFRSAINFIATIVFPKAVVPESTPISFCNNCSIALDCSSRNCPQNSTSIVISDFVLSFILVLAPDSDKTAFNADSQPRGKHKNSVVSSEHAMIRGILLVDNRNACA